MPVTTFEWVCIGAACASRLRGVTTEGTDRDLSSEGADPNGGSVWAIDLSSAKVMMRRNGMVKK
jgi:hypothetical protein